MKTKIAIVGASIAGSISAILLDRLGFDITVFEKSKGNETIVDRGAGIWLPPALIVTLIDKNILSPEFSTLENKERPIYTYDALTDQERLLTSHPCNGKAVNWLSLYEDLKKHRPENKIIYNALVTDIKKNHLIINEAQQQQFDYCIFADGITSLGRRHLFPNSKPTFTKTIIWRGTLDRIDEQTTRRLAEKPSFFVCERGHLLIYLIPSRDPSKPYRINWLFYESTDASHELFQGDDLKASQNVIKGTMTPEYRQYLQKVATKYFSKFPREIILATAEPFTQAIYEMLIPDYSLNNMALIGDAGVLLRPHTAIGATKAIQEALSLAEQLEKDNNIAAALKNWSQARYLFGKNQFELGQRLGELFVTAMPNWQQLSKQQMDELWQTVSPHCWYAGR